jgi:hypothetical protein
MPTRGPGIGPAEWLIAVGCGVFVLVLAISAVFVPDVRWLHVFQAGPYIAAVFLSIRHSRWGYFIGVSAAGLWNYATFFTSPLFVDVWHRLDRPEVLIQGSGWLGNSLVIIGSAWAYARRTDRSRADIGRFAVAFVLSTAFLAAAVAIFSPGRLGFFPGLLHPRWPSLSR